ncbi:hypothetical protein [Mycobacterium sp. DL592]|uniref:hypothetical protein n=1 Tax=Mycobacterium sp. DL592 TaxID=2675524 RepID=UPI0014235113|nr:hypothetical protein [Mycobacterium sp. DL592]
MKDNKQSAAIGLARLRPFALLAGAAAIVGMGAFAFSQPDIPVGGGPIPQAGSGSAPVNTSYTQPAAPGMQMGGTATETTPDSVLPTTKAVPAH